MTIRTYSELIKLPTFEERFEYLRLDGEIGVATFGFDRYLNQKFYSSDPEWRALRRDIIIRDMGCDLGILDRPIDYKRDIIVHHLNPVTVDDIIHRTDHLLNPEYLITTYRATHSAIHYGDPNLLKNTFVERSPYDTCPWKLNQKEDWYD